MLYNIHVERYLATIMFEEASTILKLNRSIINENKNNDGSRIYPWVAL